MRIQISMAKSEKYSKHPARKNITPRKSAKKTSIMNKCSILMDIHRSVEIAMPSDYETAVALVASQERKFVLYDSAPNRLILLKPSRSIKGLWRGGIGTKKTPYTLEKKSILAGKHHLDIINKDGKYHTMAWVTTADKVKEALKSGVFDPQYIQDPLAKMIAQMGEYKRTVLERSRELDRTVTHNEERLEIVDTSQDLLAILRPLNRCINGYHAQKSPQVNLETTMKALASTIKSLQALHNDLLTKTFPIPPHRQIMSDAIQNILKNLTGYDAKLQILLKETPAPDERQIRQLLESYGTDNL